MLSMLTTDQVAAWKQVLEVCAPHDFYHQSRYHVLAEARGEGTAQLFVYTEGDVTIALPLLIRTLEDQPGAQQGWKDAVSVYGYAGPVASTNDVPPSVIANFQSELRRRLGELQVVSVFCRLNPFLRQDALLAGMGDCRCTRSTVSIDLTLPLEVQRSKFRKNHKESINRLRRGGVTCVQDREGKYFSEFCRIYLETMDRVEAGQAYFFSEDHFRHLLTELDANARLFVGLQNGRPLCGGLFIECCGILQYHLGGTLSEALNLSPMKLLVDDVRVWATSQGYRVFHLGGGTSDDADDSLLHFKRGFSDRVHDFSVWQWVLMPDAYHRLCAEKAGWNYKNCLQTSSANYFPIYRAPTILDNRGTLSSHIPEAACIPGGAS